MCQVLKGISRLSGLYILSAYVFIVIFFFLCSLRQHIYCDYIFLYVSTFLEKYLVYQTLNIYVFERKKTID